MQWGIFISFYHNLTKNEMEENILDAEKLTNALYEKMSAEQDKYRAWLVAQPPEEILNHTAEYSTREDILMAMDFIELTKAQVSALLDSPTPLADVYKNWSNMDFNLMDNITAAIEDRADTVIRQAEELCKAPLYKESYEYAYQHGEGDQHIASNRANIACKEAIEKAVSGHYHDNCLDVKAAVRDVVKRFGYERMLYVLANTVQAQGGDGRVSQSNKKWAQSIPVVFEGGKRDVSYLITRAHSGLLDMFVSQARHEFLLRQPLKAADIKAEAEHILKRIQEAQEPNSPNGTHYMAQVSPDFLARAKTRDTDRLMSMLPFQSLSLSGLEGRGGVYALISRDENRFQKLVLRKSSVKKKLQEKAEETAAGPALGKSKSKDQER